MGNLAQFAATPKVGIAQVSTANTARDGSGTLATIFTPGANGARVDKITIVATGTTTAGMVRLFIHDGANARLYREIEVTAITPTATVKAFLESFVPLNGLILPTGYSLRASTHNAETFNVIAEGGDF